MNKDTDKYVAKYVPFDKQAQRYDAWFDGEKGQYIFPIEVACVRALTAGLKTPWLEVGVGTGRFAAALGISHGIDPSTEALKYAGNKGITVQHGFAEELPCTEASYGTIFMIVTVCFLTDSDRAFQRCAAVLKNGGSLIIGLVPKDSSWGQMYAKKAREGHPFYEPATFYTCAEVRNLTRRHGFELTQSQSCLLEPPSSDLTKLRAPQAGLRPGAGFVGMRFVLQD